MINLRTYGHGAVCSVMIMIFDDSMNHIEFQCDSIIDSFEDEVSSRAAS